MTKAITQEEFEGLFPSMTFNDLSRKAFEQMKKFPEWEAETESMAMLLVFPANRSDGTEWSLILECTAKKIFMTKNGDIVDFGIVSLKISDEEMPDEALDRYNDFLKEKQKNNVPLSKH